MAKESNGVVLPPTAVQNGGAVNNDKASVGAKKPKRVITTKNGNTRVDL
jgi:hypothetical protein